MPDALPAFASQFPSTTLKSEQVLFKVGDAISNMHFVSSGIIVLERYTSDGYVTCFQRATAGSFLAEASVHAAQYHCDARVLDAASVHMIPMSEFRSAVITNPELVLAWSQYLSAAIQKARLSAEIRGLRTVSQRLTAWLDINKVAPASGGWRSVAEEIAVSPEALYRELGQRRAHR